MVEIISTYISATSFAVTNDYTDIFSVGRAVRGDNGIDGYSRGTVSSSSYTFNTTTVNLNTVEGILTSNLVSTTVGITDVITGSLVDHDHSNYGKGGFITEEYFKIHNATGETLYDGKVVHTLGTLDAGGLPNIGLAISNTHEGIDGTIFVTTYDIPDGQDGFVIFRGKITNIDTDHLNLGTVYLSTTISGEMTNTRPEFPSYVVKIGECSIKDISDGEITVSIHGHETETNINFWNGVFRESFDFRTSSAGVTVTGTLTPTNGHPDMTMMFSDGFTMLDTDPGASILLTAGLDDNPQTNYVYIPKSTKALTVSISDWPTAEHIRVAELVLRSAATTATDGALRNQNWNDHMQSTDSHQGHLTHITSAIREKIGATWKSGVEGSSTIDAGSTPDDVWVVTTAGRVQHMHEQDFPAFDTETGDDLHIVNHSSTPYVTITNLNTQLLDASGNSLNNKSFSFVLWGVANKTNEISHLMINLPSDNYAFSSPNDAVTDAFNYAVYDIPAQFQGIGFLIARFTYRYRNDEWELFDTEDLRGKIPNVTAGGGAGGTGVTTYLGLTDTPSAYTGHANKVVAVTPSETALEFTSLSGTINHGDLTGLGDTSDHTWAALLDGTRDITGDQRFESNVIVGGNFTVSGTTFYTAVEEVLIEDNTLVLNYGETGAGVTAGTAGIEIDRGSEVNYRFVFNEAQDNFRVGISGSEQAVATREDSPIDTYVAWWDTSNVMMSTVGSLPISTVASDDDLATLSGSLQTQIDSIETDVLDLGSILTVSGTYTGNKIQITTSEAVSFGDVLAQNVDFTWAKATATVSGIPWPAYFMSLSTASGSIDALVSGQICNTTWNWIAEDLWLDVEDGQMRQTVTSGVEQGVQPLGRALSSTTVYFTGYAGHGRY